MKAQRNRKEAGLQPAQRPTSNAQRSTPNVERAESAYDLGERLLEYAARIIRLMDSLFETKAGNHIGGQLLRSGTAPLASHGEAQAAESIDDFIHKLKICLKELEESHRWLRLIFITPLVAKPERVTPLLDETKQLIRIFAASLQTAKRRKCGETNIAEEAESDLPAWIVTPWELGVGSWASGVKPPAGPVTYKKRSRARRIPR